MNTVCLFSTQRPMANGLFDTIQGNALKSWAALGVPIVLFGADSKTSYASVSNITVVSNVECNDRGIPYIKSMFDGVQRAVKADLYCYLNADIILSSEFTELVDKFPLELAGQQFIAAGRRWNVEVMRDVPAEAFAETEKFKTDMLEYAQVTGELFWPSAVDYFLFPDGMMWSEMPKLVVGHAGWDNWMLWEVCRRGGSLIDLTSSLNVYHQNHPCVHQSDLNAANRAIAGYGFKDLTHATHEYRGGNLLKK